MKNNQDDDEIALTAFDGTCNSCGKPVHRTKDCRVRKSATKLKGKCHDCGRLGLKSKTVGRDP